MSLQTLYNDIRYREFDWLIPCEIFQHKSLNKCKNKEDKEEKPRMTKKKGMITMNLICKARTGQELFGVNRKKHE